MNGWKRGLFVLASIAGISSLFAQDYKLVWEDNFNGNSLDSSIWCIEEKVGVWNTGDNAEFQHYTADNVQVGDDGDGNNCLILTAKKESYKGFSYTSGKVTTKGKLAFRRGKMEAFIKIPDLANGLWPAFWTLGYTPLGWPDCGEIDILEMGHAKGITENTQNSFMGAHLFWGPYNGGFPNYGTEFTASEDLNTGYFKHTLVWDETKISVYFNDAATPYFTMGITGDDFEEFQDYQHYILFNLAVGGSLPGISDINNITAPVPASMYVDWVKIYQEEGAEDIDSKALPIFGEYGVYEELSSTTISMNYGFDLFDNTIGLTKTTGGSAYEGDDLLAYNTTSGSDFELSLTSAAVRNMQNYNNGSIQFAIKTTITDDLQIGVADTLGNENFITLSAGSENDIVRDGGWQIFSLNLSDLISDVDIAALKELLIIKASPSSNGLLAIDQVLYKETAAASGYYAIFSDNTAIYDGFIIDNVTKHMYIWNNTVVFNENWPAYEGENVFSFKSSGDLGWYGFGFFSDNPLNFQAYADGYLNVSIRTKSLSSFYIGMDSEGFEDKIDFDGENDPYGFKRDGNWYHLQIPISDLTDKGLDLAAIKHVFKFGGGSIGDVGLDDIYLSEGVSDIENYGICFLNRIDLDPKTKTVKPGDRFQIKATTVNQFGNAFDKDITWSCDDDVISSSGLFKSDAEGVFSVSASQDGVTSVATITVSSTTSVSEINESGLKSYYKNNLNQLEIEGINGEAKLSVINLSGQIIYSESTNEPNVIVDMNNEPAGIYILRVVSVDKIYTNKFVKR